MDIRRYRFDYYISCEYDSMLMNKKNYKRHERNLLQVSKSRYENMDDIQPLSSIIEDYDFIPNGMFSLYTDSFLHDDIDCLIIAKYDYIPCKKTIQDYLKHKIVGTVL